MKSPGPRKSFELLQSIKSPDIEVLVRDLELIREGYVINYVIDPGDIFSFCFPYGIKHDQKGRSIDEIGDEMIAYNYLFQNYQPIILDEYKIELFVNRNNAFAAVRKELNRNLFQELEHRWDKANRDERKDLLYELSKSSTFLLASALLTRSFLERFDSTLKRLQIDNFQLETNEYGDENIIYEAFRKNRRSTWSAQVFKEWVLEKEADDFFARKSHFRIEAELKSAYRDCVVIDRICNINNELQKNRSIQGKYLFLYFSSATRSAEIFKMEQTLAHLPTLKSTAKNWTSYDILRSKKHAYLLFLCSHKDPGKTMQYLQRLLNVAEKAEESNAQFPETEFEDIKIRLRAEFEETNVKTQIDQHKDYQDKIEDLIGRIESEGADISQLRQPYQELLDNAKVASASISPLKKMEVDYSIQSSLSILLRLLNDGKEVNLHKGKDVIEGNYQHLPILLFLDNPNRINEKLKSLLFEIIDVVVKAPKIRNEKLQTFFDTIKALYSESEHVYSAADKSFREDLYYSSILIKSLIYLVLPFKEDGERQDRDAFTFVNDAFSMLESAHSFETEKTTDLYSIFARTAQSYRKWHLDYRYFLLWASRRNEDERSLVIANEAIRVAPDDPRFHHGRCLVLYTEYADKDNLKVVRPELLDALIDSADEAIRLYSETKDKRTNKHYKHFIVGSILALNNTILYAAVIMHLNYFEKTIQYPTLTQEKVVRFSLDSLRKGNYDAIRKAEVGVANPFDSFPDLAHTKAVLELCEAIAFLNFDKTDEAVAQITNSRLTIDCALTIDPESALYRKTKKKIDEWEGRILRAA